MNVLTSDSLSIGYNSKSNQKIVLKDLTLSLSEKSLICLIGINGSGKSTLLRTLAKFQPSLEWEVKINNTDINDLSPKDLAKNIAVVLTHNEITGKMTVGEVIAMGRYPYTN